MAKTSATPLPASYPQHLKLSLHTRKGCLKKITRLLAAKPVPVFGQMKVQHTLGQSSKTDCGCPSGRGTETGQFSSVQPLDQLGHSGGHEGRFRIRSSSSFFSAEGPCQQFWHGQICPLFYVVHLPTTVSPTLQDALKDFVLERLLWHVICVNYASFCLLTDARRGSCGPTRKLILHSTQSLVRMVRYLYISAICLLTIPP